ncbi:hypothetical protein EDD86DRAFT_65844 [Gorgonomyces haynaldii]|nr:hypothetical protein EDD86DRAFT_65844 [Gorgonomyces haynaldii]
METFQMSKFRVYSIPPEKMMEIQNEFNRFDVNETGRIFVKEARLAVKNLRLDPEDAEFVEMLKRAQDYQMGKVRFEQFVDVLKSQLSIIASRKEIRAIYDFIAERKIVVEQEKQEEMGLTRSNSTVNAVQEILKNKGKGQRKPKESLSDGFIRLGNLKAALKEMGELMTEQEMQEMMDECDREKQGKITLAEFERMMLKTNLW